MRNFFVAPLLVAAAALGGLSERALAADAAPTLVKAPLPAPAAPNWAGFYAGATFGWGWEDPTVTPTGNDVDSIGLLAGMSGAQRNSRSDRLASVTRDRSAASRRVGIGRPGALSPASKPTSAHPALPAKARRHPHL
jgi:hypothetical protein